MLHRIAPYDATALPANENMNVTPEYLSEFIEKTKKDGWTYLSIDEMYYRIKKHKKFYKSIVLTADDGYRDNLIYGEEVVRSYDVPMCVYITTSFPDMTSKLWWYALEDAILMDNARGEKLLDSEKNILNHQFIQLRKIFMSEHYNDSESFFLKKFPDFELDWSKYRLKYCMDWDELSVFARNPLITIGAHTQNHIALSMLSYEDAVNEIAVSKDRLESKIKLPVEHFSYPFGDREDSDSREYLMVKNLGFKTGTTTKAGLIYSYMSGDEFSLPRIMLRSASEIKNYSSIRFIAKDIVKKVLYWDR
jgi:peptidoglycan/xylan/chitin deacetylase (PgdA/CDA1 family)